MGKPLSKFDRLVPNLIATIDSSVSAPHRMIIPFINEVRGGVDEHYYECVAIHNGVAKHYRFDISYPEDSTSQLGHFLVTASVPFATSAYIAVEPVSSVI